MEIKILEKEPISLPRVTKMISEAGKKAELLDVQKKIQGTAKKYAKTSEANAEKLEKEIVELGIPALTKEVIVEVINTMPADVSELRTIFMSSKVSVAPENLNKILDLILKYRKK